MRTRRLYLSALLVLTVAFGCAPDSGMTSASSAPASPSPRQDLAEKRAGDLVLESGWVRQPPTKDMTAAYFVLRNTGDRADQLTGLSSPGVAKVMLHETVQTGEGAEKMSKVRLPYRLPPGGRLRLEPGGHHLMLVGLDERYRPGQQVTVTLRFEHAGKLTANLPVLARTDEPRD